MAKKKKNKIEPLVSEEQQKKLQALANEMITIASNLIDEYEDEDLDFSSLASLSGSAQFITQIHEDSQVKEFLITIIHEIRHAMDAKQYGWKKFKEMYEMEMNLMVQQGKNEYADNKYEIEAEEFGQKHWNKWYKQFKKEGLI